MRVLALMLAGLIALGSAEASVSDRTELRISFWPRGKDVGALESWTLRCQPLGGTFPRAAGACRRLTALRDLFAPVPAGVACSHIYSGPQLALVTGSFRGRRVWTYFKRTDGCQTERWNRVAFLFPPVTATVSY
jgi:hypothetical protein